MAAEEQKWWSRAKTWRVCNKWFIQEEWERREREWDDIVRDVAVRRKRETRNEYVDWKGGKDSQKGVDSWSDETESRKQTRCAAIHSCGLYLSRANAYMQKWGIYFCWSWGRGQWRFWQVSFNLCCTASPEMKLIHAFYLLIWRGWRTTTASDVVGSSYVEVTNCYIIMLFESVLVWESWSQTCCM